MGLYAFRDRAKALNAQLLLAPAKKTDAITNLGTTAGVTTEFKGQAFRDEPGLIKRAALVHLDGANDALVVKGAGVFTTNSVRTFFLVFSRENNLNRKTLIGSDAVSEKGPVRIQLEPIEGNTKCRLFIQLGKEEGTVINNKALEEALGLGIGTFSFAIGINSSSKKIWVWVNGKPIVTELEVKPHTGEAGNLLLGAYRSDFAESLNGNVLPFMQKALISNTGEIEGLHKAAFETLEGIAKLEGKGTLTAKGRIAKVGAAVLSGAGTLVAAGERILTGRATLSGVGGLIAVGRRVLTGKANLAGSGTLSARGKVKGPRAKLDTRPFVQRNLVVPRLAYPFQVGRDGALMVEQGSDQDVTNCVEVLMRTRPGQRHDLPSYGTPDLAFVMDLDEDSIDEILELINRWEPRAEVEISISGEGTREPNIEINVRSK